MDRGKTLSRRKMLAFAGAALVGAAARPARAAAPSILYFRRLALYNVNTGESYTSIFWANDYYIPQALRSLNWALRDFHTNTTHPIDPRLLDLLVALQQKLDIDEPFLLTSGYRTPETNARLVAEGAAVNSLHMRGQAADISLRGRTLSQLHMAALSLRGGGVGYYPAHSFIHVDVGPVRTWGGGASSYVATATPSAPAPTTAPAASAMPQQTSAPSQVLVVRGGQHPTRDTIAVKPVPLKSGGFLLN
ncbi:MAG TPA: DUF882 domain-containing protein [Stellaceae bacterium]|nr:DUF882 domain-containing protein [Stellaceae bacterium]